MTIAVLSGKGGTGKTTVSASLAVAIGQCQYVDCDAEEPNGALFLKPNIDHSEKVYVQVPKIKESLCDGCGDCVKACMFNALAAVKRKIIVFPQMCHHCGACTIACKKGAVYETPREVGVIEAGGNKFLQGRLNIGELITIPIISRLKQMMRSDAPVILDCAPGASCTVVKTISGCDYCVLVTEPTPFGLNDLKIAVKLVTKMGIKFGVVINKAMENDKSIEDYCGRLGIPVLMKIPYSRKIAQDYSKGILPVHADKPYKKMFLKLYETIRAGAVT